jgi:hypothetical protein
MPDTQKPIDPGDIKQLLYNCAKSCQATDDLIKTIDELTKALNTVDIAKTQSSILGKLDSIEKNGQRNNGILLGIIVSMLGLKAINTPWYVDVAVGIALISGVFLSYTAIIWWKYLSLAQRVNLIAFSALMIVSASTQIWIYHPGLEPAPEWFTPLINGLLIIVAGTLIWVGWTVIPKSVHHKKF